MEYGDPSKTTAAHAQLKRDGEDYKEAAALDALVAPYRHSHLGAVKLAGDPNNPLRIRDDATAEELRAEVMRHIVRLMDAGIIDLQALPAPKSGIAPPGHGANQSAVNGG